MSNNYNRAENNPPINNKENINNYNGLENISNNYVEENPNNNEENLKKNTNQQNQFNNYENIHEKYNRTDDPYKSVKYSPIKNFLLLSLNSLQKTNYSLQINQNNDIFYRNQHYI